MSTTETNDLHADRRPKRNPPKVVFILIAIVVLLVAGIAAFSATTDDDERAGLEDDVTVEDVVADSSAFSDEDVQLSAAIVEVLHPQLIAVSSEYDDKAELLVVSREPLEFSVPDVPQDPQPGDVLKVEGRTAESPSVISEIIGSMPDGADDYDTIFVADEAVYYDGPGT